MAVADQWYSSSIDSRFEITMHAFVSMAHYCNVTVMVDESYTGKHCCYYYIAAIDDDLVQISIDTSVLGER
jgi:hypothetical protein